MTQKEATIHSLRLLADAIEREEVEYVRGDIMAAQRETFPETGQQKPRRISLFVEVKV